MRHGSDGAPSRMAVACPTVADGWGTSIARRGLTPKDALTCRSAVTQLCRFRWIGAKWTEREHQRQTLSHHLAGGGRLVGRDHRPDAAAAWLAIADAHDRGRCRPRHQDHAGARRAADRRDGGLRRLPGAARRTPRTRRWMRAIAHAGGAAADGHQPALGAGGDAQCRAQPARATSAWRQPTRAPPKSATTDVETNRRIGEHGLRARSRRRPRARRRARRQRAHPLQRRLARLRGLGHGAGADL